MDELPSELFQDILKNNPSLKDTFTGFFWYPEATARYAKTAYSVPHMLSGAEYNYLNPNWRSDYCNKSIFKLLCNEDQDIDYSPFFDLFTCAFLQKSKGGLDNNQSNNKKVNDIYKSNELVKIVPFRFLPQILKSHVFYMPFIGMTGDNGHMDLDFNSEFLHNFNVGSNRTKVKFYYLYAGHPPYKYNQTLHLIEDATHYDQASGAINIVKNIVNNLKAAKIYDKTSIILSADHGNGSISDLSRIFHGKTI